MVNINDNRSDVVSRINELSNKVDIELDKEYDRIDRKKVFDLMYAQFIAGLKLNSGSRYY